jgi:hypothetical protein
LVCVATETNFKITEARVKRVAQRWRRLGRAFVAEHPLVPSLACEAISFFARGSGALCRGTDRASEKMLP